MPRLPWVMEVFLLLLGPGAGDLPGPTAAAARFDPGIVPFRVHYRDEETSYRVNAVFLLPGETLELRLVEGKGAGPFSARSPQGPLEAAGENRWRWRAPKLAGDHTLVVQPAAGGQAMTFHVFVLVPAERRQGEYLNGYRIGSYPKVALHDLDIYRPPAGFVEVTPANVDTPLSPHFRLGQFLCKQDGGYPKYLVLRERLILKLEAMLAAVNEQGYRCDTFQVMSGYRTPYYNKAIGNVRYSRHCWGGAADIFIDESPREGMMDDLNGDGLIDYHDADVLYDIIDGLVGKPWYAPFVGGLARYRTTRDHGPFVHVDVRGFRTRWGT